MRFKATDVSFLFIQNVFLLVRKNICGAENENVFKFQVCRLNHINLLHILTSVGRKPLEKLQQSLQNKSMNNRLINAVSIIVS